MYYNCMKPDKKRMAGYMTVEAALVLSTVFMVYLFLIFSFLIMYDRCVLEQDMAALLLRCANAEEEELERVWQQETGDLDTEKYLWMDLQEPILQKQGWRLSVSARGDAGQWGSFGITYNMWEFTPGEWLRMSKRFAQVEEKEKGESER